MRRSILLLICVAGLLGPSLAHAQAPRMSAEQLQREYEENEILAESRYKNRIVEVSGVVAEIGRELFTREAYIVLGAMRVRCVFPSETEGSVARLKVGQSATVQGEVIQKYGMFVLLKRCSLVSAARVITNSVGMKLTLIPVGEFMMGSPEGEGRPNEHPQHRVRITRPFYLGVTEVTRGHFRRFVEETGYRTELERSGEGGLGWNEEKKSVEVDSKYTWRNLGFEQTDEHPVGLMSWNDAMAFCEWLSKKEGKKYRLPTEAEWEYACRAGTPTRFFSGDDPESLAMVANVADGIARAESANHPKASTIAKRDGFAFTAPVGQFTPNTFGLYDMHGNVNEWCQDMYDAEYYSRSPREDPPGPSQTSLLESEIIALGMSPKRVPPGPSAIPYRVTRGGNWYGDPRCAGSSFRVGIPPSLRYLMYNGFRVVQE